MTGTVDNHLLQRFGDATPLAISGGVTRFVGNLCNTSATYDYDTTK